MKTRRLRHPRFTAALLTILLLSTTTSCGNMDNIMAVSYTHLTLPTN